MSVLSEIRGFLSTLVSLAGGRGTLPTYRVDFAVSGATGSAVELVGSPTARLLIQQIVYVKPGTAHTLKIKKLRTLSTGGTSSPGTIIPLDSRFSNSGATVNLYTVAPTQGTVVGNLYDGAVAVGDVLIDEYGNERNSSPLVLNGINETVALDISGNSTITGYIEWTEAPL